MSTLKEYSNAAKGLAKNPLGIIALFIVLIYGFAALVVGSSTQIGSDERYPLVWFLVIFPVIVLGIFGWLVSRHYEKLYAPKDYNSDEAFLKALGEKSIGRPGLKDIDNQIEQKVKEVLTSIEITDATNNKLELKETLKKAADTITNEIRNSSFITIDARQFTGSDENIFELPASAFHTLQELLNEIFFSMIDYVGPYEYGYSWVVRNIKNGAIIQNYEMIFGTKTGYRQPDIRTLSEVGIIPGMVLEVVKPKDGKKFFS